MNIAVLGLGNELLGDEGVGGHVITSYSIHYTKLYDFIVLLQRIFPAGFSTTLQIVPPVLVTVL